MYQYSIYGRKISSCLEFPQLIVNQEEKESDIVILEGAVPEAVLESAKHKYYEIGEKTSWFQNDTGVFYIADGKEIHYQLKSGANLQYARTYILGYGVSMLLLQKGVITIHCSAIAKDDGAILIAGESGAGKSTITTNYLKHGYRLLADDIAAVEIQEEGAVLAYPAFPYQKLCRDTINREKMELNRLIYIDEEKDKFLVPRMEQFTNSPVEVKAMVILGINDGVQLVKEEVMGVNKLLAIRENLFLKKFRGNWLVKPDLVKMCLKMGSRVPIYVIARPRKGDTRAAMGETLKSILQERVF